MPGELRQNQRNCSSHPGKENYTRKMGKSSHPKNLWPEDRKRWQGAQNTAVAVLWFGQGTKGQRQREQTEKKGKMLGERGGTVNGASGVSGGGGPNIRKLWFLKGHKAEVGFNWALETESGQKGRGGQQEIP